jgi:hypothetical protein
VSASSLELARILGDRTRETVARSSRIARRSTILVESSRYPATESLVPHCAWCELTDQTYVLGG